MKTLWKNGKFAIKEGRRVLVGRPAKPEVALRFARLSAVENDPKLLKQALAAAGPYTFAGYLGRGRKLLDAKGKILGKIKPGDSFFRDDRKDREIGKEAPVEEAEPMDDQLKEEAES